MSQAIGSVRLGARTAFRSRWVASPLLPTVGLGLLVLAVALLYVWQHIHVVRMGYEVEQLRHEKATRVQEYKALRLELGQLRSLRRVEEIARSRLGMVTPKRGQVLLVPESPVQ